MMKPRDFQMTGIDFLRSHHYALLADEQGLGKTAQALWALGALPGPPHRVLIVCLNSLITEWENEIAKIFGPEMSVTRVKDVRACKTYGIHIINFESVREKNSQFHKLMGQWDLLIVDESHTLKSRKTQNFKGFKKLMWQCKRAWFLSGTPIQNYVDELWTTLNLLQPHKYRSYWKFAQEYANAKPGEYGWEVDKQAPDPEALAEEVKDFVLRRTKQEVMPELPPFIRRMIPVQPSQTQKMLIKSIKADILTDVGNGKVLFHPAVIAKMTRLKQVAISPRLLNEEQPHGPKIEAMWEVLPQIEGKIVVFSTMIAPLVQLASGLAPLTHRFITGEVDDMDERRTTIEEFKSNPFVKYLLMTVRSGGTGLNLGFASTVVFIDRDFNPKINEQAEARVHRMTTTISPTVIDFITQESIEEWIHGVLRDKNAGIDAVMQAIQENLK
jgi:SNF2 family DNA or RNA helicase